MYTFKDKIVRVPQKQKKREKKRKEDILFYWNVTENFEKLCF